VAELECAIYTLNHSPAGLGWLFGLGPGAGYQNPFGYPLGLYNEYGEPDFIHGAAGLITFRYGLVGLCAYFGQVFFAAKGLLLFARRLRTRASASPWDLFVLGFAAALGIVADLPITLSGLTYFGGLYFGVLMAVQAYCLGERRAGSAPLKRARLRLPDNERGQYGSGGWWPDGNTGG
jgi:hypothetical protein